MICGQEKSIINHQISNMISKIAKRNQIYTCGSIINQQGFFFSRSNYRLGIKFYLIMDMIRPSILCYRNMYQHFSASGNYYERARN